MRNILILTTVLMLSACASNKEELPEPTTPVAPVITGPAITYTNHTKRLFDSYCTSCHAAGQTQSFWPLSTYSQVSVYSNTGGKIQTRVLDAGNMPPSGSAAGFLTAAEKDTLQMWLNQGAPQ